jgi:hypothetical protein
MDPLESFFQESITVWALLFFVSLFFMKRIYSWFKKLHFYRYCQTGVVLINEKPLIIGVALIFILCMFFPKPREIALSLLALVVGINAFLFVTNFLQKR